MNKGADYEVILGWNNLRNTAKANMHKEDFRINPIVYITKLQQKSEMRKDIVIELSYKGFG